MRRNEARYGGRQKKKGGLMARVGNYAVKQAALHARTRARAHTHTHTRQREAETETEAEAEAGTKRQRLR